ncbi:MAG: hypothetical protein HOC79_07945 [Euryarchaeota archaeon]|nr:hypothetical protein [Euryarchaeota archaeon]
MDGVSETLTESIGDTHDLKIFGIPQDIALVLAIDAVLISLRVSQILTTNNFIGAKVLGTTALIGMHFL